MGRPTTCSGDMYPYFPFSVPAWVFDSRRCACAMPKSPSFTSPRFEMKMFDGEMSRCTICIGLPSMSRALCA